jgi:putative phosphoesterase
MRVGLIADTHGLLRAEAVNALAGSDCILHAGDVGKPEIIEGLTRIAPVHAVRGNVDRAGTVSELPERLELDLAGWRILIVHERPAAGRAPGADVVVFGHSHLPLVERARDKLWVNPGSAGPRRFRLPVSVGRLELAGRRPEARLETLAVSPSRRRDGPRG